MTYLVVEVETSHKGSKVAYLIADTRDGSIVGKAIVNYHKRKSFWYYLSPRGRKIKDRESKSKMRVAVDKYKEVKDDIARRDHTGT